VKMVEETAGRSEKRGRKQKALHKMGQFRNLLTVVAVEKWGGTRESRTITFANTGRNSEGRKLWLLGFGQ